MQLYPVQMLLEEDLHKHKLLFKDLNRQAKEQKPLPFTRIFWKYLEELKITGPEFVNNLQMFCFAS